MEDAAMLKPAWHITVPGLVLVVAPCSEASAAYVGDRFFPSTLATGHARVRLPLHLQQAHYQGLVGVFHGDLARN
ncbi:hypothetical protein MES5069_510021 [Mesorhizobium escarrei]|uniref:Uncharacterized protein n=1 Tax=Mesorhizobium escarrei TaxID=666018 RepID=A0ABN8K718_9HYPH|nr:hypothetical protein MES5069_510021 [Mesorhizobium escarrei]